MAHHQTSLVLTAALLSLVASQSSCGDSPQNESIVPGSVGGAPGAVAEGGGRSAPLGCTPDGGCEPAGATCVTELGTSCVCSARTQSWSCQVAAGGSGSGGAESLPCVSGGDCETSGASCTLASGLPCICSAVTGTWSCSAGIGGAAGSPSTGIGGAIVIGSGGSTATGLTPCQPGAEANRGCTSGHTLMFDPLWVWNNQWGDQSATDQCVFSTCSSGSMIGWGTSFAKTGAPNTVKSFSSAVLGWHWGWKVPPERTGLPLRISEDHSITCDWDYTVTREGTVTMNVVYDLWVHSVELTGASNEWDTDGVPEFRPTDEIMIWLYRSNGAGPISRTGSPVAEFTIAGEDFELHEGAVTGQDQSGATITYWNVYSFVKKENAETGMRLDLKDFFGALATRGFSTSKYLSSIEAGTEVFLGTGRLDTSSFGCLIE